CSSDLNPGAIKPKSLNMNSLRARRVLVCGDLFSLAHTRFAAWPWSFLGGISSRGNLFVSFCAFRPPCVPGGAFPGGSRANLFSNGSCRTDSRAGGDADRAHSGARPLSHRTARPGAGGAGGGASPGRPQARSRRRFHAARQGGGAGGGGGGRRSA